MPLAIDLLQVQNREVEEPPSYVSRDEFPTDRKVALKLRHYFRKKA